MKLGNFLAILFISVAMYYIYNLMSSEHFWIGIGLSYQEVSKWILLSPFLSPLIVLGLSYIILKIVLPDEAERVILPLIGVLFLIWGFVTIQNKEFLRLLGYKYKIILKIRDIAKVIGIPILLIGLAISLRE